jgi:KUP system potassium uptake protein
MDPPLPIERVPTQHDTDLRHLVMLAERHGYVAYVIPGPAPGTCVVCNASSVCSSAAESSHLPGTRLRLEKVLPVSSASNVPAALSSRSANGTGRRLALARRLATWVCSDALASAYGIAVTMTMIATTLLLYFAARRVWNWSKLRAGTLCFLLLVLEGAFLAANSTKIFQGGWLPLAIGGVVFLLMTTWKTGRYLLRKNAAQMLSLRDLIASTTALGRESGLPARVPGTAVFLAGRTQGAPMSLLHNLKHNRVLHERNIVLTILTDRIPYIAKDARIEIKDLSHGFFRIIAHFGFMESPTIGEIVECCAMKDFVIEEQKTSFFLGRETIICTGKPGMARWREHLFVAMSHHAQTPAQFFRLPVNRIVELGGRVEI